jgi:hypothetical protein
MGAGTHGKTSTIFYRRGVPNVFWDYGALVAGNYAIYQPSGILFNKGFFTRRISNLVSSYR